MKLSNPQNKTKNAKNKNLAEKKIKCRFCKSRNFTKQGYRETEHRGKVQKYKCSECGKYFTEDNGFYRMRYSERIITKSIDLYFSNLSSRKVRNNFRRHEETNITHHTVLNWARKYSKLVNDYVNTLKPSLSGQSYADDTEIKVQGKDTHLWVSVDWGTRFINGIHYSENSGIEEAKTFLKNISRFEYPKFIQTDSAGFYPKAFKKTFGRTKKKPLVEHKIQNVYRTKKHNVRIETVFMKIKDRVNDFRGLKAKWSAELLLNGLLLQHNFIEEHTTTGKLPCELAKISLECGLNRWLGLIRLCCL